MLTDDTDPTHEAHLLHLVTFWLSMLIIVIVFGGVLYSLFRFRHSQGDRAAHLHTLFHKSAVVELIWTLIPFVLLAVMAIPAIAKFKAMYDANQAGQDVTVTGRQHWRYEYPDQCLAETSQAHCRIVPGRSHADVGDS